MPEDIKPADVSNTETVVDTKPADDAKPQEPVTPEALAAEVEKWKGLSRKNEERAKENAGKATEYDKFLESQRTEQEKLELAKTTAEKQAAETAAELARMKAAVKHGLTEDDLDLLGSGTAEEIEVRAEKLAARLKATATTETTPDPRKAPDSRAQGDVGGGLVGGDSLDALDSKIAEASKARRFEEVIALKQQRAAIAANAKKN